MRRRVALLLASACAAAIAALLAAAEGPARQAGGSPFALVTAETANEVLAVSLPDGRVLRRVRLRAPEAIAAGASGPAVVVSPSGTVTLLAYRSLRPLEVFRSLRSPQIAAIAPGGTLAYVTDGAGYLAVIDLAGRRIVDTVHVGRGAHHLAISPDGTRIWVALGELASTIVVLDSSQPARPRVVARFHPRVAAHDLAFAPDGRTVWVTSASAPFVSVLAAHGGELVARVAAGEAPQHVVFAPYGRGRALITSGYGSTIEEVDVRTRRIVGRAEVPYGSFNVAASGGIVAVASLLGGRVTELDGATLARRMTARPAAATRDLAISVWP